MMRSNSMRRRSRDNGVGPYHLHLAEAMKSMKGVKRGTAKHSKAVKAAHAKAKAALAAGAALPPSHKRSLKSRNVQIQKRKGHKKTLRGGHGVKAFAALPVSERSKIRAGALASVPASMRPKSGKSKSNKMAGDAMRLFRSGKAKTLGEAWAMVKGGKSAGKSAGAAKTTAKKAGASSKPKAATPVRTVAMSSKKDAKGRMQYRMGGKLVSKKTFEAAKKAAGKGASTRKPPSASKKAATRAKKSNPNFGMALDGVKQFGRDFVTLQSVGGAAVVGLAHGFVAPMIAEKLNEYLPQRVTIPVLDVEVGASDFAFTATGLVAGAVLGGLGYALGRPNLGLGLGLLAAGSGVVIDTVGFVMNARAGSSDAGSSEMGEIDNRDVVYGAIDNDGDVYGAIYDEVPGGPTVYGDVAYGSIVGSGPMNYGAACESEYSDAMAGDAQYSGSDFSDAEGQALMDGPVSWLKRFGRPAKRATGVRSAMSRHAGKEGHRWGWLIKLVGMEKAKQIAALAPEKRLAVIDALRKQAISSLANLMATQSVGTTQQTELTAAMANAPKVNLLPAPEQAGLDFTGAAGGASAAGGALSYGAYAYVGGGF